ncbi:uncharacterized protein LOC141856570 isoform X2 [Brevipalpus obovatus]|uniref:uncharacterized protein LOC141856570 isoform X2 n=1 Tax=Brevipalpus obovatus TaxID=246614 RepID=UPI003D9E73DB
MRKICRSILFGHLLIGSILILISCAIPEDSEDEEEETDQEDRNIMIDDMLSLVKQEIDDNASSLSFPDFEYDFSDKSSLLIRNARFLGLQELSREDDADVHGTQNGDALIVNCGFLIREAKVWKEFDYLLVSTIIRNKNR